MSSISKESQISNSTNEEDSLSQYAMQLVSASVFPMVLKAAIELGVLEIIERAGPGALLSPSQIASELPTHKNVEAPLLLDHILQLLSAHSILTCSVQTDHQHDHDHDHDEKVLRLYGLAPVSKYFIRNQQDGGGSLAPLLGLIQDKVMMDVWYHLKDAVLEGGLPFHRAHGMSASEYAAGKDARFFDVFKGSMKEFNPVLMKKILEIYKGFEGLKSLVDVGGGDGTILNMIISKYPTIKGLNFDLAPVVEKSVCYPVIERVAGDMFESIPKGDAILMKWILHHYDDEQCLKVLKNCYEALPEHGKVIVIDLVIPEAAETSDAGKSLFQYNLFMVTVNPQGKERIEREYRSLAKAAGFSGVGVACCAYNYSVVEFYKN